MAPEDVELIGRLLLRGGMIVEDHSPEFISLLPADERIVAARIESLRKTGGQLVVLAAAAAAILNDGVE